MNFDSGKEAGWHVVLGDNGAGKSSVIRALGLIFSGGSNISATRQNWTNWLRVGELEGGVTAQIAPDFDHDGSLVTDPSAKPADKGGITQKFDVTVKLIRDLSTPSAEVVRIEFPDSTVADQSLWSLAPGWFSASYGPYRRFTGGISVDYSTLDYRRAAAHFSAFGEDVALTAAIPWLTQLHVSSLENPSGPDAQIRDEVIKFVNNSELLPHGSVIKEINAQKVVLVDGQGKDIPVEQMSDGYRSVLSLTFELLRQMFVVYGTEVALDRIDADNAKIHLPGVVAIDEIDAHLHPAWQARIGQWFTERFPMVQFIVTTHSPIICRAAANGSIWRLPAPGSDFAPGRLTGQDYDRLVKGNILEAMGTEFFGEQVTRSEAASEDLDKIARLNKRLALGQINKAEEGELKRLQAAMPMFAASIAA